MNILQVCNKYPFPANDGGNIAITNLTEGFIDNGAHVDIIAMATHKHKEEKDCIPSSLKNKISVIPVDVNTKINVFNFLGNLLFSKLPYNATRFISKHFRELLIKHLNKNHHDVIQLEGLYLFPYLDDIKCNSNGIIAYRAHNVEYEIWAQNATLEKNIFKEIILKILSRRIRKMETDIINKYDLLIPISDTDKEKFKKMGNAKPTMTIPCGYNLDQLPEKASTSRITYPAFFYIGALDWAPNIDGLIWFLEKVWKQFSHNNKAVFYIAGRNASKQFINYLNQQTSVIFLGEIQDAKEFILSHDVLVIPLFSGSGMRVKIIEAMALGKPIITTKTGISGIQAKEGDNILIADNEKEFIYKMNEITHDKKLFTKISHNATSFIKENFNNFVISSSLIDFYNNNL